MDTNDLEILNLRSRGSLFVEIRAIRGQEILPEAPTKGLALCKNPQWAMDRNLIAPCPDHHWKVSAILDPRRSNGEKELIALSGKTLLLPQDEAFHPDAEGLGWRCEQMIA